MSEIIVAPNVRDLDELAATLVGWLRDKMPAASQLAVTNLTYPRGAGRSHETILFDVEWMEGGQARRQGCVVRIKPTRFQIYPDDLFDQQYGVIAALHEDGQVKVPRPLWIEHDTSILGAPFFVMEKLVGRVPVSYPSYAQSGWVVDASPEHRYIGRRRQDADPRS
jgi:aminoglycoside phosphotransferase (APT) family kinase protein